MLKTSIAGMSRQLKISADLQISAAAMAVQRRRLKIIAENTANQDSRNYQRKIIRVENRFDPALGVYLPAVKGVVLDTKPVTRSYNPGHPDADAQGFVAGSNVEGAIEEGDRRAANYNYSANLKAYENTRSMLLKSLSLLDR